MNFMMTIWQAWWLFGMSLWYIIDSLAKVTIVSSLIAFWPSLVISIHRFVVQPSYWCSVTTTTVSVQQFSPLQLQAASAGAASASNAAAIALQSALSIGELIQSVPWPTIVTTSTLSDHPISALRVVKPGHHQQLAFLRSNLAKVL